VALPDRVRLDVSWLTILKIASAVALIWIWLQIWPIVMVAIVSLVLSIALEPVVRWLEGRRIARGLAVLGIGVVTLATLGVLVYLAISPLTREAKAFGKTFSTLQESVAVHLPVAVARVVRRGPQDPAALMSAVASTVSDFSGALLSAGAMALFAFILTLYLLADGHRTYEWVLAYVPKAQRAKADETFAGVSIAAVAYVAANLLTSIFASAFVLASLTLLGVPASVMLAVLAGICDFVPIIGFFVALTPAVLIALTVSPGTALSVVGAYTLCSVIENYAIAPKLYGHHLKVSRVAVLLSLAVGAALGGIVGALLALPTAAAYPIVERIWLHKSLGQDVLAEHARLEHEGE
jgi:predicted PurR-regulated permease PerM